MLFSELYSAYYNAVASVLRAASEHPLERGELRRIVEENAFAESSLNIESAIGEERWQLIAPDGTPITKRPPTMPLTTLQKRWIKAIMLDPRIRLFTDETDVFPDVEPLFTPDDYIVFDRYSDGDPYENEKYIRHFRLILSAIRDRTALCIDMTNREGSIIRVVLMPEYLEYSEKDDKFRLFGSGNRHGSIVNLGRIVECKPHVGDFEIRGATPPISKKCLLEFEVCDRRNALERVLLHFAHFEKQAKKIDDERCRVTLYYDEDDETELVIRVLSFGPMIKVTSPDRFVELIKERLKMQKSYGN